MKTSENLNHVTMGNQQGRLYWLAGLTDGEGNFCASYSTPSRKEKKKQVIRICYQIGMTDERAMNIVSKIMDENNIVKFYYKDIKKDITRKNVYQLKVSSLGGILKLIELIEDKLITKKEIAQLMKKYCLSRLERKNKSRNSPYKMSEIEIIEKIRRINNGNQTRTLRDFTPRLPIEDDR